MSTNFITRKKIKAWIMVFSLLFSFVLIPMNTYAAEAGTTMNNPINTIFDWVYSKSWTKSTYKLNCYHKIVLDEQGILGMVFDKPCDSKGEYGSLSIKIYDSRGNLVWDTDCRKSKESASSYYVFCVGLAKGEYYVSFKPGFYVSSGTITSLYSFFFVPAEHCEVEPNEAASKATLMKTNGEFYLGYYGEGDDVEDADFFKFNLTAGKTYKICMGNFSEVRASTIIMYIYDPKGNYEYVNSKFNRVDENGCDYFEYTAKETGTYYLEIQNYYGKQISYQVSIGISPCAEHTYDEGVVTRQPTISEEGIMTYTCTVCGATLDVWLDKLPSFGWSTIGDKSYWYEGGIKQGTYGDANGVIGAGTVRGREIYDPDSDGWYWLDACYDGAKACNKEVWMPYIYQQEKSWSEEEIINNSYASGDMAGQIAQAIHEGTGKWVRYDADGRMYKGWYTVTGSDAELYPSQVGNTYYYDPKTGLMAKGYVVIEGITHYFNEVTGVLVF